MEARERVRIQNASGLHARPCHAVVTTALSYQSDLRVAYRDREVNGKSILELMTLEAPPGAEIELSARGPDAQALVRAVAELVAKGFSERG